MKLRRKSRKYFGVKCSGGKQPDVRVVCLHSTEGPTAAGAASYLHTRPDGSVHIVVDDRDAYELADRGTITCGAGGFNTGVYHVEQAGFASWSRVQWLRRLRTLRRAAYWTARELRRNDLPPKPLRSGRELQHGKGYTFHAWVTDAGYPTTHTDPGPHYPFLKMRALVRYYYHRVGRNPK